MRTAIPITGKCDICGKVLERDSKRKPFRDAAHIEFAMKMHKRMAHPDQKESPAPRALLETAAAEPASPGIITRTCDICGKVLDKDSKGIPYRSEIHAAHGLRLHKVRAHGAVNPNGTARRKYTKRTIPGTPVHAEARVNFCPNCGCNLGQVAMGMVLAQQQR